MKYSLSSLIEFFRNKLGLVVFFFSTAVIFGPAFALFSEYSYDFAANPDIDTYLNLAEFNFNQSPYRRYRVIIPFIATGVNWIFEPIFTILSPNSFPGPNFSLCMSFLVVNTLLMSLFGSIIFTLSKAYGTSTIAAFLGLLAVLTCRWTAYLAGLPIIDSLYIVIIGLTLLGIKIKNSRFIVISILLGPWAKESYLFIAPLILIYSSMNKWKQIGWFALSGLLVFSFRYYFDWINNIEVAESLGKDIDTINNIIPSVKNLFSFHGLYEVFSVLGVWSLFLLLFINKNIRSRFKLKAPRYNILFIIIILIHAFLSTDLARMFYLLTPLFAVWIAILFDELILFNKNLPH